MYNIFRNINFMDLANFPKKHHNLTLDTLYGVRTLGRKTLGRKTLGRRPTKQDSTA